jgi:2'-5' RNA ligase
VTRAFVAVRPPEDVLDALAGMSASLDVGSGMRLTTRDQWHVTLQFLGNKADVDEVAAALANLSVAGDVARIGGAGAFPSERRGRVLWLGLAEGAELLAQLAVAVAALLVRLGHEPEERPFHPHVTLARCKVATDLRPVVAALGQDPVGPPWRVSEVVVFESRLRSTGAQYVPRATIPLR